MSYDIISDFQEIFFIIPLYRVPMMDCKCYTISISFVRYDSNRMIKDYDIPTPHPSQTHIPFLKTTLSDKHIPND